MKDKKFTQLEKKVSKAAEDLKKREQELRDYKDSKVLKIGTWYRRENEKSLFCVTSEIKENGMFECYGFDCDGLWMTDLVPQSFPDNEIPATKNQVEGNLRKEANKRGFKGGVKFERSHELLYKAGYSGNPKICHFEAGFKMRNHGLYDNAGQIIFFGGVWATIVEEKPKNPKLVEVIEAEDMVEYYAKKLKEANIHLKKLKQ